MPADENHVKPRSFAATNLDQGNLNDREATVTIDGDPLATTSRETPYNFTLDERSSGSISRSRVLAIRLISVLDGSFEATAPTSRTSIFWSA